MTDGDSLRILREKAAMRALSDGWRRAGETVAVVPTMGALHDGHLSLVDAARARADRVVVTLFVNPRQFDDPEDYAKYPRTEEDDARKLIPHGADVLYVPGPAEMYPEGFATTVSVAGPALGLCGAARPGHFDGVATVVTKLLMQTGADLAFFGEKDHQQVQVVRRLVADLDLPVTIIPCPTLREADGLAMSSRNGRLSPAMRDAAPAIFAALTVAARAIATGDDPDSAVEAARAALDAAGLGPLDYLEFRPEGDGGGRLYAAVFAGGVRLIDNVAVAPPAL